jgi:hypothetical protein
VLGQVEVGGKTNEIPLFTALLDRIEIKDAVVTADALHAQREHARYLARRGAHYVITLKGTSPACTPSSLPCPGGRSPSRTRLAAVRSGQHRRRPALPRTAARPATPDDHEVLTALAAAVEEVVPMHTGRALRDPRGMAKA